MRYISSLPSIFFETLLHDLDRLSPQHVYVALYLLGGRGTHITGIYMLSVAMVAEALRLDADLVRSIVFDLANLGWCEYEPPVIWIRGLGNYRDQLGRGFRNDPSALVMTLRHLERELPTDNPLVLSFRAEFEITGITSDQASAKHPRTAKGKGNGNGKGKGTARLSGPCNDSLTSPSDESLTTGVTTGSETPSKPRRVIKFGVKP